MILAHRGNVAGKSLFENQIDYLLDAAQLGYGLETDLIRAKDNGRLIISHDPFDYEPEMDAELVLKELGSTFIALNVKAPGLCEDLKKVCPEFNGFVFDFELCCPDPEAEIREYRAAGYKIARRYSDRGEFPLGFYDYIWFDEMDQTGSLDSRKIDLSKTIYVSPELHGRDILEARIDQFLGVCTDYCDFYMRDDS